MWNGPVTSNDATTTGAATTFAGMWRDLAPVGRDGRSNGYQRFAWTREDHTLREWFVGEAEQRGLDVTVDRVGNQWAWWGDPDAALAAGRPGIATGSHLDSVPDGGAFDGPLGVVSAFAAIDALRERGFEPDRPIAVVNFVDEEGARFGVACAGSRVLTGAMTADRARSLTDADGVTMAEALRAAGRDPQELGPDADTVRRVGTFVELHVEQGRSPCPRSTSPSRWAVTSGRTGAGACTRSERPTTPGPHAWPTATTPCSASPPPSSPPVAPPSPRLRRDDRQGRRHARRSQRHRQRGHRLARRPRQ